MAKTYCINEHMLSDYDMKPTVWAFRIGFLREYALAYPNATIGDDFQPYDATEWVQDEDLNCWFCDDCHCLTVFTKQDETTEDRYDYAPMASLPDIKLSDCDGWTAYMGFRDEPFEEFQDSVEGCTIPEMLDKYEKSDNLRYMLSPDKKTLLCFRRDGGLEHGYALARFLKLDYSKEEHRPPEYRMYSTFKERNEQRYIDDSSL